IGADRAAVFEIAEDLQRVFDDLMRLAALDVGDETDAAGIFVVARIVETLRLGYARIGAVAILKARVEARAQRGAVRAHALREHNLAIAILAHRLSSHARPPGRLPTHFPRFQRGSALAQTKLN